MTIKAKTPRSALVRATPPLTELMKEADIVQTSPPRDEGEPDNPVLTVQLRAKRLANLLITQDTMGNVERFDPFEGELAAFVGQLKSVKP